MRKHGVRLPAPEVSASGARLDYKAVNTASAKYKRAFSACARQLAPNLLDQHGKAKTNTIQIPGLHIHIKGIHIKGGPMWVLHPLYCENVVIRNVVVESYPGANTDGVDVDSCRHVRISDSYFDTGDDAICLKSGKDVDGRRVNRVTEDVTITNCTVRRAHTPDVLLDLATFFLHRPLAKLPEPQRKRLLELDQTDRIVAGKKVLIVDDDMRNIFALSTVLEEHDMVIVSADNGRDAIRILQADPAIDIVLMDIMMPEMDGMETMREIRKIPQLKNLPIVAVTAKAMKGDREKCIEAGAWDYLSKPVDTTHLLAVLRAWLYR